MKRNALVMLSVFLLLTVSSVTNAADPDFLYASGDCDGWLVGGKMSYGIQDYVDYDITIELFQGVDLVYDHYMEGTMYQVDGRDWTFNGRWGMDLCGDYKMVVTFWWYNEYGPGVAKVEYEFKCECQSVACTFTPGYWKNHPEEWPVETLTVGCIDYTKAELLDIFDRPTRGNVAVKLFHHLVAAKLNVLGGSDDYIMGDITDADDYFCMYPLNRRGYGDNGRTGELKKPLVDYNEIPCEEEDYDEMLAIEGPAAMENSAATEDATWGSIKKKHQ